MKQRVVEGIYPFFQTDGFRISEDGSSGGWVIQFQDLRFVMISSFQNFENKKN
jgi:hypothetical protein